MTSVAEMNAVRGTFLFKKVEQAILDLEASSESEQRSKELASLEYLKHRLLTKIVSSAHGFTYLTLSLFEEDGGLRFLDGTEGEKFREVSLLIDKYGMPESFNSELTLEVVIELVEATMKDAQVWNYTKRLCANELQCGRALHPLLLRFVGVALVVPAQKGKAGRSGLKNAYRNQVLSNLAGHLKSHFGLPFSRGVGSHSDSVCSVISDAMMAFGLHMTEETIRKAIEKHEADTIKNVINSEDIVSGD
jgi:hypothetical protein